MNQETPETIVDESELIANRRAKLSVLREKGDAYPNTFKRDSLAGELHEKYDSLEKETLETKKIVVKIAGRMMLCARWAKQVLFNCKTCQDAFNVIYEKMTCLMIFTMNLRIGI